MEVGGKLSKFLPWGHSEYGMVITAQPAVEHLEDRLDG